MDEFIEKTGDILPLYPNKKVKIIKKFNGYAVVCQVSDKTPGTYSIINVKENTWYYVDFRIQKYGFGNPGLWIATDKKKTLFFGNFVTEIYPIYLRRKFFTGSNNKLIIGILSRNPTKMLRKGITGFFVNQFSIEEFNKDFNKDFNKYINKDFNKDFNELDNFNLKKIEYRDNPYNLYSEYNYPKPDYSKPIYINIPDSNLYVPVIQEPLEIKYKTEENALVMTKDYIYQCKELNSDFYIEVNIKKYNIKDLEFYPISFGIPEELILENSPKKRKDFFPQKIGEEPIFTYKSNTEKYLRDLKESRFIIINKFGNEWETPLVIEALSQGCIPLFLEKIPENCFQFIPKDFLNGIKAAEGINIGWIDHSIFSKEGYDKINKYLISYTKNNLSTRSLAKYFISQTKKDVRKVLFFSYSHESNDFLLQQSLLHGLKTLLGYSNVVDFPKVESLYKVSEKAKIHRKGIPYMGTLPDVKVNRDDIGNRIRNKEFDIIVFMGIFTHNDRKRLGLEGLYPYQKVIEHIYNRNELVVVDGGDDIEKTRDKLINFRDISLIFRKEGY